MSPRIKALERLMDSLLSIDLAEELVGLRVDEKMQARLDELGDKCNEGQLTAEEREEYETYVEAIGYLSLLQAKARTLLKHQRA